MKPTPFNPETDRAPIPFSTDLYEKARQLKQHGLPWTPHVGCFVWDPDEHIEVSSPFPGRVYFILNVGHFLKTFETRDAIAEKLVWLPTWQQARGLCEEFGIDEGEIKAVIAEKSFKPSADVMILYDLLLQYLQSG